MAGFVRMSIHRSLVRPDPIETIGVKAEPASIHLTPAARHPDIRTSKASHHPTLVTTCLAGSPSQVCLPRPHRQPSSFPSNSIPATLFLSLGCYSNRCLGNKNFHGANHSKWYSTNCRPSRWCMLHRGNHGPRDNRCRATPTTTQRPAVVSQDR